MSVVFSHAYLDDADRVKNCIFYRTEPKMAAIQKLNPTDLSKSLFL